ncbi:carboxypeptidase-like regulatory domain-containing protein [Seonamhaeicola marinus]|uniref:Carboxypeptidase-like regulatory domain-containing protein n=1 Tax=Seonamhaeicola marinus TaxID=1912246 RepID=A0A5D0I4C6_9FLAO|nr:carboxypeptidase-like regulatory domain-containing protein [Seonamhaeicola marinus]TYA78583.1 carboxypeptidase-like regulatory domain-containing protein [Seonamhaeicola marinus]
MKQTITLILIVLPSICLSQKIQGKIYDEDSTVKGALIINLTKKDTTYSDVKGSFKMNTSSGDVLLFKSFFHIQKKTKITEEHFTNVQVFELKKRVNDLEEVLLTNEKEKQFEAKTYTADFGAALANDIKNNPHLYKPKSSYSAGIDLGRLIDLIGVTKLLKKKKKYEIKLINYNQIDSLFSNSKLFNNQLIFDQLGIPKDYKFLFFEYIEAQNLNCELLSTKENIELLDTIYKLGNDFSNILEENKVPKTSEKN